MKNVDLRSSSKYMSRATETKKAVLATDREAQYDEMAKRLLSQKIILAHILVHTIKEFEGMKPEEVVPLIEGEPYIGTVSVEPGLTNTKTGERIIGFNSENQEVNEGVCRFDLVFYVRRKNGLQKMIINMEAQKSEAEDYHLMNRGLFYCCRLISSQKGRDFVSSNYDEINPVFSIWIVMNCKEDCLTHVHLKQDNLLGGGHWEGATDILNLFMIGIGKESSEHSEKHELHHFLRTIFSDLMPTEKKLDIIEKKYRIPLENEIGKDVREMCNLSLYFKERGIEEGIKLGMAREKEKNQKILAEKDEMIESLRKQLSIMANSKSQSYC